MLTLRVKEEEILELIRMADLFRDCLLEIGEAIKRNGRQPSEFEEVFAANRQELLAAVERIERWRYTLLAGAIARRQGIVFGDPDSHNYA